LPDAGRLAAGREIPRLKLRGSIRLPYRVVHAELARDVVYVGRTAATTSVPVRDGAEELGSDR
jgi:hypothetical protein